ncbi:AAA family ATPase [Nocardioides dilutus]
MVGRAAVISELEERLRSRQPARGGVVSLAGPAGIGKTVVADELVSRWPGTTLRGIGVQTAAVLPHATLGQLLEPLHAHIDTLPTRQATALSGALALGPAVRGDPLAVAVAALGLIRAEAQERPVLLVVDDVPWVDAPSLDCLAFLAKRVWELDVGLLLVRRVDDRVPEWVLGVDTVELGPLPPQSAHDVVVDRSPDTAVQVRQLVVEEAAGNPLALVDLLESMTAEQRRGTAPVATPLRASGRLHLAFDERLRRLPAQEARALLVCAAAHTARASTLTAALRGLGIPAETLVGLADRGMIALAEGEVILAHPLLRGACYHRADGSQRREAHLALARVVGEDEKPWHLAAAAVGLDESAAEALVGLATRAAERRAYDTAVRALRRACDLIADDRQAADWLLWAASLALTGNAGLDQVTALVEAGRCRAAADSPTQLRLRYVLGLARHRASTDLLAVEREMAESATRTTDVDHDLSASMLALASYCALVRGDCRSSRSHAEAGAARLAAGSDPDSRAGVLATLAAGLAYRGDPEGAADALDRLQAIAAEVSPGGQALALPLALQTTVGLGRYAEAQSVCTLFIDDLRDRGDLTALPFLLATASDAAYRRGGWASADPLAEEARALAVETHQTSVVCMASVVLARLRAACGRRAEAVALLDEVATFAGDRDMGALLGYERATRLFLALGDGDVERASGLVPGLDELDEQLGILEPTMIPWRVDAVEALARGGRRDEARRQLRILSDRADLYRSALALAWVARGKILLEDDPDAAFTAALEHHGPDGSPFERARTLLVHGERLRRDQRPREARRWLREALEHFEGLGAEPWASRAAAELAAVGGRRRRASTGPEPLTDREHRIAELVARGFTNREIAAALFVSAKTVEFHLGKIFRKTGANKRAELAAAYAVGTLSGAEAAKQATD